MKNNYKTLILMLLSFFVLQNIVGQNKLKESKNSSKISNYLSKNKKKYDLSDADFKDVYINREMYSKSTGITHSYLNQAYKGIKIHNAISTIAIKDNNIFHFANKFKKNISTKINTELPTLSSQQAIQKVATHFNLGSTGDLQFLGVKNLKNIYSKGGISQENIPVELVYFQLPDESLRLSWDLSIYTLDSKHWWSVRVDAITGELLDINDWVISCKFQEDHVKHGAIKMDELENNSFNLFKTEAYTVADGAQYNVFALPDESPNHGSIGVVVNPAETTASPYGWHDTDGIAGAEYTITRGNNVWALDDIANDDGTDGESPDGTASLNFNFPIDLNQEPIDYLDGATTNLFYMNNMMHDIFYNHGFDELSGNFQANNYGNGGIEGDYVVADVQDGGDIDNANFATPPDGNSGKMQVYLWNGLQTLPHLTINGGTLAGGYNATLPSNADGDNGVGNITRPSKTEITGDLVIVDDGTEASNEGCNALINGTSLSGKIALIKRGNCNFTVKIQNAQDAGAIAVIVSNHNNPDNDPNYVDYISMYGVTDPVLTIPSIFVNFTDGDAMFSAIEGGETLNVTIKNNTPIQRDGSLDNGIIAHEYGHGISIRLAGGADNSGCLDTTFQAGEGWSDWFALMVTMKASDLGTDGRGIGTYAFSLPVDDLGIRRRKYSTDLAINEYTYNDTNDNTKYGTDPDTGNPLILNRDIYYHGTIWATMLWDLTWAYIDKYGFDSDFFNGTGGNNRVMKIVIEGLKLQGCGAEYLEARDAILAADIALNGGEDQCLIWDVFARRGLGVNASEGISFKNEDQVADFTTPDSSDSSLANCTTLSSDSFTSKDYIVYPNPANTKLFIKSGKNLGNVLITVVDINGRQVLTKEVNLVREIELDVSNLKSGLYILNFKGDGVSSNKKIIIY